MSRLGNRTAKMLARLSGEQNHRCCYCGIRFGEGRARATIEHVRTRARGGSNHWENLAAACERCNNLRDNQNAFRFFKRRGWLRLTKREQATVDPAWTPPTVPIPTISTIWPGGIAA